MLPDGIGDACLRPANIRTPVSNLRLLTGEQVEFTSVVTEASFVSPLTYAWDFAGGASVSAAASPGSVQFDTPGSFLISLTVTDAGGTGTVYPTETRLIVVEGGGPTVDAGGPYLGTEGNSIELTAIASTPVGVITDTTWSFGDGTPDAGGNPILHTWTSQGSYAISVIVTDDSSQTASDATSVEVADSGPVVDFAFMQNSPTSFDFTDLSTAYDGVIAWSWDFGDGSPPATEQNPTHVFASATSHDVTLTVTDGDGSIDAVTLTVGVAQVPIPPSTGGWLVVLLLLMGSWQLIHRVSREQIPIGVDSAS